MEKITTTCTCDDNCDDACPMHAREHALQDKVLELEQELEQWKDASGLMCGGDPDGVTPAAMKKYWEGVEQELQFSREREENITDRAKTLLARKAKEIKQLQKSKITIAKLRNYLNGDLPNDGDYYLTGTVFVEDIEDIIDEDNIKFVKAGPVVIKKVEGDVGYTILMLVEDDDWDYWPYAENYSLLVPLAYQKHQDTDKVACIAAIPEMTENELTEESGRKVQ